MIMPTTNRLRVIDDSGELRPFSSQELCLNLLRSFLASGLREESWVAEDLALAVEYTLERGKRESGIYSESELNAMVVKVLEQTGYPEVAARFSSDANVAVVKCLPEPGTLRPILRRHLAVKPETADQLAEKTAAACKSLGLDAITPVLAVEMARALYDKREQIMPEPIKTTSVRGSTPWLISAEELLANLPEISHKMIEDGILCVYGVSRMFPSLRIKCAFEQMALELRLDPPITEMMLLPALDQAAQAIDEIVVSAEKLAGNSSLPLVIEIERPNDFAENWLDIFVENGLGALTPLTQSLTEMLQHPPFKII
jgi:hypothetical protein